MTMNQIRSMVLVAAMALAALPAYLLIGILTIPLGIGLLMLNSSSPWILNLYPFVYASSGAWNAPVYYLDNAVSVPLTILQWCLIAWAGSPVLRECRRGKAVLAAFALLLVVCVITSGILSLLDVQLMWAAGHT